VAEDPKPTLLGKNVPKQVPRKRLPSKVEFLGTACNYNSQKRFPSKVPGTVSKQGSKQEQGSQEQVLKQAFPGRAGSQAIFPGTSFQARFARTGSQARVPRTVPQVPKQGFQEQVSLQGSKVGLSKVLGNRFPSKVSTNRSPSNVPKDRFASKLCKNRFGFQEQIL